MAKTEELTGHAFVTLNACFLGYLSGDAHELKADDGSYNEMFYDEGRVAFAAPICRPCWLKRQEATLPDYKAQPTKKRGKR